MLNNLSKTTTSDNEIAENPCKICGKQLLPLAIINGDPYCSTKCCKEDYEVDWEQLKYKTYRS